MNKKIIIIVLIVVVIGLAYFGYQKGFFSKAGIGGIDKNSVMGMMKANGETVMSKSEYISKCKESDKDTQDMCLGMGALYYRDASFCKLMKDNEARKNCNQKTIDEWYNSLNSSGMSGLTGIGGLSGLGGLTGLGGGIIPNDGGNTGTGIPTGNEQENLFNETQEVTLSSSTSTIFTGNVKPEIEKIFSKARVTAYGMYSDYKGSFEAEIKVPRVIKPEDLTKLEEVYLKQGFETKGNSVSAGSGTLTMAKSDETEIEFSYYDFDNQNLRVRYIPVQATN